MRRILAAGALTLTTSLVSLPTLAQAAESGEKLLATRCGSCHEPLPNGGLKRISQERKTPEGWDMSIFRMRLWHGVEISEDEQKTLVEYLSDKQGLAPEETAPFRYILERRPDVVEKPDDQVGEMCARCHSVARVGLQRRDADEWVKLANMHLGQFASLEYQALGRDRNWFEVATTKTAKLLGERFPFMTAAWSDWVTRPKKSPEGSWQVTGHQPGLGSFDGTAIIAKAGRDYTVHYDLTYSDGRKTHADGKASLYTGYEWRGSTSFDGNEVREVFALSTDGNSFGGRFYNTRADSIGGEINAIRADRGSTQILSLAPGYIKAGTSATVTIHGVGLTGKVDLGAGATVKRVVSTSPTAITVEVEAKADAAPGAYKVAVGGASGDSSFAVYRQIDSVRVEPAQAIARVGGGGGQNPAAPAQFEAIGFLNGPDGKPGTADDIRIGEFQAVWSTANANPAAEKMRDVAFAGQIDSQKGFFTPAAAGPNPERKFGTNNTGDLSVVAKVKDGDREVEGESHLVVTVQRWVDPPVR